MKRTEVPHRFACCIGGSKFSERCWFEGMFGSTKHFFVPYKIKTIIMSWTSLGRVHINKAYYIRCSFAQIHRFAMNRMLERTHFAAASLLRTHFAAAQIPKLVYVSSWWTTIPSHSPVSMIWCSVVAGMGDGVASLALASNVLFSIFHVFHLPYLAVSKKIIFQRYFPSMANFGGVCT